ncbi:MAG: hypothetical protein ACC742_14825, partial [Thermoanaerobaculales bacterium]
MTSPPPDTDICKTSVSPILPQAGSHLVTGYNFWRGGEASLSLDSVQAPGAGVSEWQEETAKASATMQSIREPILLAPLIIAFATVASLAHAQEPASNEKPPDPSYVVVLKNGQRIPARTKPVSAFGKLRYM